MVYAWVAAVKGNDEVQNKPPSKQTFSVKGLPYISKNFTGDRYSATRHKIRKWIQQEFDCEKDSIARIYVNMDSADIQFTLTGDFKGKQWSEELSNMIKKSPTGEIRLSWEKKLKDTNSEKDWLQPFKASIYLPEMYKTYEALKTNREIVMNLYKQFDIPIYEQYQFEKGFDDEMEMFLIQNEIDEILCESDDEFDNDGIEDISCALSDLSLKRKRENEFSFVFDSDDLYHPTKKMYIQETFESDKETWTPQEICEKIRLLQGCGTIKISTEDMNKITQAFGERRELK